MMRKEPHSGNPVTEKNHTGVRQVSFHYKNLYKNSQVIELSDKFDAMKNRGGRKRRDVKNKQNKLE